MTPFALITGGAHRLGRLFALEAARQGYAVALHYHRARRQAEAAAAEIRALGREVVLLPADLRDSQQVLALFDELDRNLAAAPGGELRLLVNSAAEMPAADVLTLTPEAWDATLALNLRAPFLCAQQAARRMTGGGLIINISDVAAEKTWSRYPAYTVSKAALEALTRILARALAPSVRVNAIAPGLALPAESLAPADWEKLTGRLPLPRAASPAELTSALEFLLKNEYITGQVIRVDGGYSLI
ncbi:MAG: SDR family oxidoreductase [Anaerolineales bacterium]